MRLFLSLLFSIILFPFFSFAADRVIVIDDGGGGGASTAAGLSYDPSAVYHSETTVQDAIDAISPAAAGTAEASKALVPDSNIDIGALRYAYADRWSFNGDTDTYTSATGDVLTETVGGIVSRTATETGSTITHAVTGDVAVGGDVTMSDELTMTGTSIKISSTSDAAQVNVYGGTVANGIPFIALYGKLNAYGSAFAIDGGYETANNPTQTSAVRAADAYTSASSPNDDGGDIEISGGNSAAASGNGGDVYIDGGTGTDNPGDVKICTNRGNAIIGGNLSVTGYVTAPKRHGEMEMYESAATQTIDTANAYHLVRNFSTGNVEDFTFNAGSTGSITAYADYSGTVAGTVSATCVGHGLITGDDISITGTTNYNDVYTVTKINDDTFYFTATWVADDGTGTFSEGSYLEVGTTGTYLCMWSITGASAVAAKNFKFELVQNSTMLDDSAAEMTPSGTAHQNTGSQCIDSFTAGDRIYLAIKNETDANNFELEHANVTIVKQ